ncbi:MAG: type VI secretion protein [Phycisphaeraceae bacterium]|nr:MAG: type VI secretion protein [Phycisphaeraceae bacterium]
MGQPAARIGDMHTCPMVDPGPKPHVGGPVVGPGCPTVLVGGVPAARVGDKATCVGPPDTIANGNPTVHIGGKPAARMGDATAHGGVIVAGLPTVLIGPTQLPCMVSAAQNGAAFIETAV